MLPSFLVDGVELSLNQNETIFLIRFHKDQQFDFIPNFLKIVSIDSIPNFVQILSNLYTPFGCITLYAQNYIFPKTLISGGPASHMWCWRNVLEAQEQGNMHWLAPHAPVFGLCLLTYPYLLGPVTCLCPQITCHVGHS